MGAGLVVGEEEFAVLFVVGMFLAMLACLEIGRRLGQHFRQRNDNGTSEGVATIDAALFALLGLLIAFTFSGAATRFEMRRELIRDEANAIGTAYLRVDLLVPAVQPLVRQDFRDYLDARLAIYADVRNPQKLQAAQVHAAAVQARLWAHVMTATAATPGVPPTTLLVPAVNEMFDMATTRTVASQAHPPFIIFGMLGFLALACSMTAGFSMSNSHRGRQALHIVAFSTAVTLTLYVILDLEYPRMGLFRIDAADQILRDVRTTMEPATR
jgi:hypothetical protein